MNKLETITYKDAIKVCIDLDKKCNADNDVELTSIGYLMCKDDIYSFVAIKFNGKLIDSKDLK